MSTHLCDINDKSLTQFYGGDARGVCLQITCDTGYVQLSAPEIVALLPTLKATIDCELSRKKPTKWKVLVKVSTFLLALQLNLLVLPWQRAERKLK